jgi:diaminopimelate epimerase
VQQNINWHIVIVEFHKMHGMGNDFVIIDSRQRACELTKENIKAMTARRYGIGCDQLIILGSSKKADCLMRIYNNDGSSASACGNATRCVSWLLDSKHAKIEVGGRIIQTTRLDGGRIAAIMGKAKVALDQRRQQHFVDVGNPHLVEFVDHMPDATEIPRRAQQILEIHNKDANVNFAKVKSRNNIELVVFERGAGITHACGTGAMATFATAHKLNMIEDNAKINQAGGELEFSIAGNDEITMIGEIAYVFKGYIDLDNHINL